MHSSRVYSYQRLWMKIGLAVIAVTLLVYFLLLDGAARFWLSFLFVLSAEAILFAVGSFGRMSVMRIALITVSGIHLLGAIVLSAIYFLVPSLSDASFIVWNVALLAAVFIADAVLLTVLRSVNRKETAVANAQSIMRQHAGLARSLADQYADTAYAKQLERLQEDLHYSDNTAITGDELHIGDLLGQLEEELKSSDDAGAQRTINRIHETINRRTQLVKQQKIGKF